MSVSLLLTRSAFRFDPEGARDVDETNSPGITLLKADIDDEVIEAYRRTESLPFRPSAHRRIALRIVDDRGIESLKALEMTE